MKIAIGISGIYRPKVGDVFKNLNDIQQKFNADMYYHTWDNRVAEVPDLYKFGNFYTSPEPVMTYHPVFDPIPTENKKHHWYRETKTFATKTIHGNKQILGYCNLYDHIPKKYDLYIRTRWDVKILPSFDFAEWYDLALEKGPVGFMIREGPGPNYFNFREPNGRMVEKDDSNKDNNDWFQMLSDCLIMHTADQLDTSHVYNLHEQKQLLASEWGWWQVLSKPFGGVDHTSVYGGVKLLR